MINWHIIRAQSIRSGWLVIVKLYFTCKITRLLFTQCRVQVAKFKWMHETSKKKILPIDYGNIAVYNESHVLYSAGRTLALSLSLDVVTYFPRLIDKGNYTEGNIVTKVYMK